jgi:glucose/arabinose dehydrogenase
MPRLNPARACLALLTAFAALALPGVASASLTGAPQEVAKGLDTPWEVVLMPDGRTLVNERPGRVRTIGPDGVLRAEPAFTDSSVDVEKFLGLELHPAYATNRLVYLYETYKTGSQSRSRILRLVDNGMTLQAEKVIFDGIGSDLIHDGGRIKFGPDGKLYVTTGDIHNPATPQDLQSLNGKILRLNPDGTPPADNPFAALGGNARYVWSYGHRHPQGIAWDATGRMWQSEHGPTGESHANGRRYRDEINRIDPAVNFGWPAIMGAETRSGMRSPASTSGDSVTWAPGGAAFASDGHLYSPLLVGESILDVTTRCDAITGQKELFKGTYGRLRAATFGRGALYFTTDGNAPDDRVMKVAVDPQGYTKPDCGDGVAGGAPAPQAQRSAPDAATKKALDRLVSRARQSIKKSGLRSLARRKALVAKAGGFKAGTVTLRVERRATKRKALTAMVGQTKATAGKTVRVKAKMTPKGRKALRGARKAKLVVRASFVDATGLRSDAVGRALSMKRR